MKRAFIVLTMLVMVLALGLSACSSNKEATGKQEENVITLKVANYFAEDHPQNVALREVFKPMVEEKSKGKLKVQIYPNSQLGAEQEFTTGVRNGTIEMGIPGMILQTIVPKLKVTEMPFLFRDYAHAKKVLNGPIGGELVAELPEKAGVRALAWSANGFRVVSSNRLIDSFDDFKGFRLRMPNIPLYLEVGKAWGATVVPLPISEVFTALEQKVVDGQENPYATLRASGWYEVQTHVMETRHMFSPNLYIINEALWQRLSPELRDVIQEAAKKAADYEWKLLEEQEEKDKAFLREKGLTITIPDETLKRQLEQAVQPIYEKFYQEHDWAKELVERIRAEAN